jgi:hypothetical protein
MLRTNWQKKSVSPVVVAATSLIVMPELKTFFPVIPIFVDLHWLVLHRLILLRSLKSMVFVIMKKN